MTQNKNGISAELAKQLIESLYVPNDNEFDVISLDGSWYIKTSAGNLETAREIRKKFDKFKDVLIENDYILCESCCEPIVWGTDAIHYLDFFYHSLCWTKKCSIYYTKIESGKA